MKQGKIAKKMFTSGWKFNLFNITGQLNKQLCAVGTIFGLMYFSLLSIAQSEFHLSFSIIVLSYSLICLFSFMNLTYVRDFDCIQVNFTPVILSVTGIIALNIEYSHTMLFMTMTLITDAYFALRFKTYSDKIKYTPLEMFAMESWTQQAFSKNN